jgi:adenylate cyclase
MRPRLLPALDARWRGAILGAVCGLVSWALALQPFSRGLEEWIQDAGFAWRRVRPSTTRVVVIGIDDATLAHLTKPLVMISPEIAQVIRYLHDQDVKAIGVDLMVPESLDPYDLDHEARGEGPGLEGKQLGLAAAMAGNVVLPVTVGDDGTAIRPLTTWQAGTTLGLIQITADVDHIVRRQELTGEIDGQKYDQFDLALINAAGLAATDRRGRLHVDLQAVPPGQAGRLRINFVGPPGTVPEVSFSRVLEAAQVQGPMPPDRRGRGVELRDAIVIIGATAHSLGDYHATPYANGTLPALINRQPRLMSGPELHANVIATLADGAFITTPWWLHPLLQVPLVGALLGWAFARLTLSQGFLLAFAHHWAWKAVALGAFWYGDWRIDVAAMLLTGMLTYGAAFAFRWRHLRLGMSAMVKGQVLTRVLEDSARHPGLRGEERAVSVLFADIRGFTEWSRRHSPREVFELLNTYFGAMIPLAEAHGGMVDKYIGDGIMVVFGAPDEQPDHAARAVESAAAMIRGVRARRPAWAQQDYADFRIGVGIATGPALVGMVGSLRRLDYTAIGDTVNSAARIESANAPLETEILISERTRNAIDPDRLLRLGCARQPILAPARGIPGGLMVYPIAVVDDGPPADRDRAANP